MAVAISPSLPNSIHKQRVLASIVARFRVQLPIFTIRFDSIPLSGSKASPPTMRQSCLQDTFPLNPS